MANRKRKRKRKIDLAKYKEDSKKGVTLEVDLEYPRELHDLHNDDYPSAPEKMKVANDMLSPYCESIRENSISASVKYII